MKEKEKGNKKIEPFRMKIRRWFDRHLHLRMGEMLKKILPSTLRQKPKGAVIMGNLVFPYETSTIEKAARYRKEINAALPEGSDFEPCMTLYLTDHITPEEVVRGFLEGVWGAVKLYMTDQKGEGGTTGSQHGVRDLLGRYRVFEAMQEHGIPLLGHWEAMEEEVDEYDREVTGMERDLIPILKNFPGFPVVFEHISDSRGADLVASEIYPNLYATVTIQHMVINRNAMYWKGMSPGHYCRPVAKREENRLKIRKYVTSGHKRFGAGTDSAPHDEEAKARCYNCAAGIFTAEEAVGRYATIFDEENAIENLEAFMSENFLYVYGRKPSSEMMTIERSPILLPRKINNVPVFQGGQELPWRLVG